MSGENIKSNDCDQDNSTPSTSTETNDVDNTEKCEDISVFNLETFQKQLSRLDGKKQKTTIVLANATNSPGSSCERDRVGDDMNKKQQHIDCECEPNVAGAAVPAVCSFNVSTAETSSEVVPEAHTSDVCDDTPVNDAPDVNISEKSEPKSTQSSKMNKFKKRISKCIL